MLLYHKVLEKEKFQNCNLVNPIFKSDINNYIVLFFERLECKDPELKNLIAQYRDFNEQRLCFYINRVSNYIDDVVYLKHFFRAIGVKYLRSRLNLAHLNSLSTIFLETLEIYSLARKEIVKQHELPQIHRIIFEAILAGAKEEYSLWNKDIENTFACVNRMKIEVIIQRALVLSYDKEEIVIQRLLQKNPYFQKALEKIGRQKTRELVESAIDLVKRKPKLGVNRK